MCIDSYDQLPSLRSSKLLVFTDTIQETQKRFRNVWLTAMLSSFSARSSLLKPWIKVEELGEYWATLDSPSQKQTNPQWPARLLHRLDFHRKLDSMKQTPNKQFWNVLEAELNQ